MHQWLCDLFVRSVDECCNVSKTVRSRLFKCGMTMVSALMQGFGLSLTSTSLCRSSSCGLPKCWTGQRYRDREFSSVSDTSLAEAPTWDCMLAPTCPPWYESPLRDCTLMNKSPEFDMLKEPAEPENTQKQRRRWRAGQRSEERR